MKSKIFMPNEFQSRAQKNIEESILKGEKSALVVMPTGTGKTYLAAQWFKLKLEKNPKSRLLYICHNQDILSQANDKEFANCLSEFDIPRGYYNGSEKNMGQITFATIQTLLRNIDGLPSDYFDYIIVDEAHHYRARGFEKTIKHFSPKFLLGLTATPNRMDGRPLSDVFGRTVYSASIRDGIKSNLLSKIKYYYVDNDIDFSEIKRDHYGKYKEKDLNKKLCIKEYDDAIIKEYTETVKRDHKRKKTICFCATVEHVYRMEKLFNDNGIKAVALSAKSYGEKGKMVTIHEGRRKRTINMFKNGDYDIIFVRDLFNEGMDIPDADCIMMLRPTESSRIFTQQIGRGLRISEGKDYLLTLDFTGNCYGCDINYEVLNDIFETDIEKDVRERTRNNNMSKIIIYNIGCEVRLSKRKIDVIKDSEEKIITKERLIENYFDLKNKYHNLTSHMVTIEKGSKFDISAYVKIFGSWNKFLDEIGEDVNHRKRVSKDLGLSLRPIEEITEEDFIKNYFDLKRKYPNLTYDMLTKKNGSKFSIWAYAKKFGSWNKFLEEIGEITEEDFIKNYFDLKRKYPNLKCNMVTLENGSKFSILTYIKRFGSWNKFLETIGEIIDDRKRISAKDLIDNYLNVKKELNMTPRCEEMNTKGKFKVGMYVRRFRSWNKFLLKMGEKIRLRSTTKSTEENLIKNYFDIKRKYPNLKPNMMTLENGSKFSMWTYIKRFGSWNKFLETIGEMTPYRKEITKDICRKNITIIQDYTPKNPLPNLNFEKSNKKSRIDTRTLIGHKYTGSNNKDNIRCKIIEKIQDEDTVLMLESPKLDALKEIEKQGKNPKKIIIPNHLEFDDLATALKRYDTNLNIEVINTSAVQYITDNSEEHVNFLWLDYCGAFSYYTRDLDIVFQKEVREMKLILTYNTFDPKKQDDSYYFTNVIGYVLKKLRGKNEILLMEDVSQRYKKTMFSVGFDIKNLMLH